MIASISMFSFIVSCSDEPSSKDGEDQVPVPVQNAGPNTEGERAVEAVKDSADSDNPRTDSGKKDSPGH